MGSAIGLHLKCICLSFLKNDSTPKNKESTGKWVCHNLEIIVVVSSKALALWFFDWIVTTPKISLLVFVLWLERTGKSRQSSSLIHNDNNLSTLLRITILPSVFLPLLPGKVGLSLVYWRNKLTTKTEVFQASPKQSCYSSRISCLLICLIRLCIIQFFS